MTEETKTEETKTEAENQEQQDEQVSNEWVDMCMELCLPEMKLLSAILHKSHARDDFEMVIKAATAMCQVKQGAVLIGTKCTAAMLAVMKVDLDDFSPESIEKHLQSMLGPGTPTD
jgi:hypothetical protein